MENFDSVSRYAKIAAESQGTAAEKIKSYTDSIEAAQQRTTVALEQLALDFNLTDAIKNFYNMLTYLTDNIEKVAIALTGIIALTKGGDILSSIGTGFISLSNKSLKLNNAYSNFFSGGVNAGNLGVGIKNFKMEMEDEQKNLVAQKYIELMNRRAAIVESGIKVEAEQLQTKLKEMNLNTSQYILDNKLLILNQQEYNAKIEELKQQGILKQEQIEQIQAIRKLTESSKNLAGSQKEAALETSKMRQKEESNIKNNFGKDLAKRTLSLGGFALGSWSFGSAAENLLGEGWGTIGTTIGSQLGMYAGQSLVEGISKFASSKSLLGALSSIGPLGAVAIATTVATSVYSAYKQAESKALKEAKENFTKVQEEFSQAISNSVDVGEYDKLVKGVDSLGRNISLTEEEYQKFLEISNQLAEAFPDMVQRVDSSGNKLLGTKGKVGEITNAIDELVESLRQARAEALLAEKDLGGIFGFFGGKTSQLDEAIDDYQKALNAENSANNKVKIAEATEKIKLEYQLPEAVYDIIPASDDARDTNQIKVIKEDWEEYYNEIIDSLQEQLENRAELDNYTISKIEKNLEETKKEKEEARKIIEELNNENYKNYDSVVGAKEFADTTSETTKQARKELDAFIDAYIDADPALRSFYNNLSDEMKQFYDAFKGSFDLTGIKNGTEMKEFLSEQFKFITDMISENPEIEENIKVCYELEPEINISEFLDSKAEILKTILAYAESQDMDAEVVKNILVNYHFVLKDGENPFEAENWIDEDDYISSLQENGYWNMLEEDAQVKIQTGYSVENVKKLISMLEVVAKVLGTDIKYSIEDINEMLASMDFDKSFSLDELAESYEKLSVKNKNGSLNKIETTQYEIVKNQMGEWSKNLGYVEKDYDEILKKIKEISLKYDENDNLTFDKVNEKAESLSKILDYFNNDFDKKTGLLTPNMFTELMDSKDIEGNYNYRSFIQTKDWSGLVEAVKKELKDLGKTTDQIYQDMMAESEEATQKMFADNKEYVEKIAESQGWVLENFKTVKEIEEIINNRACMSMLGSYAEWKTQMAIIYAEDLASFSDAQEAKARMIELQLNALQMMGNLYGVEVVGNVNEAYDKELQIFRGMTGSERRDFLNSIGLDLNSGEGEYYVYLKQQEINNAKKSSEEEAKAALEKLKKGFGKAPVNINTSKKDSSSSEETIPDESWKLKDRLEALEGLIDKEWEAMKVFDEMTGTQIKETEYFDKMAESLNARLEESIKQAEIAREEMLKAKEAADKYGDAKTKEAIEARNELGEKEKEYIELQKEQIEIQKQINNLDDEEIQDRIQMAEALEYSLETIIKLKIEELGTADTALERAEAEKEIRDLYRQQYQEMRRIKDFYSEIVEMTTELYNGTALSNSADYDTMMGYREAYNEQKLQDVLKERDRLYSLAYERFISEGYSSTDAMKKALESEEVQDLTKEYLETIKAQGELIIEGFEDRIAELDRELSLIEDSKPQQWNSISEMTQYTLKSISLIQQKINQVQITLQDVSKLTDDQIIELYDKLNEYTIALHNAQIELKESIQEYQEKQFGAVEWKIGTYIDELEKAKDKIDELYKPELEKLNQINAEYERQIKLEDLLAKKKQASQEKERVYRSGIGWVYEANRNKVKEAQQNLDDFYRDDRIQDLESTKDREKEILDERIKQWQDYLDALKEKYESYQHLEDERLLKELLNAQTEEEIRQKLTDDMLAFNVRAEQGFDQYTGIFDNFLSEYGKNLAELDALVHKQINLFNASQSLQANNSLYQIPNTNYTPSTNKWPGNNNSYSNLPTQADDWSSVALSAASAGNRVLAEHAFKQRQIKLDSRTPEQNKLALSKWTQEALWAEIQKRLQGYASGIENGPVTSTGMFMLHGSENSPEYVLNNDQAYTLLKNLSTIEMNNSTASMSDESESSMGAYGLAKTELEGINTLIKQIDAVISSGALTNSQLSEMMNILSNLYIAQQQIQQFTENDYNQDKEFYTNLLDDLDKYFTDLLSAMDKGIENIEASLNVIQGLLEKGINSIDGLVAGIGGISQGITNLGSQITGLGNAIDNLNTGVTSPSYNDIYGDFVSGGLNNNNTTNNNNNMSTWKTSSDNWAQDALDAANRGNRAEANYYLAMRKLKLESGYNGTGGIYGTDTSQTKLKEEVERILTSKGYATGLEQGPVTNTGVAMLHGTPGKPEYVLNNDQAYQILKNLATQEIEINSSTSSMEDLNDASIGITELVEDEIEGLNTIIIQLSGVLNGQALTNAQMAELMRMLDIVQQYSIMLHQAITDEFIKNDSRFITLCETMERIIEQLEIDITNDGVNASLIISSIDKVSSNLIGGLNELASIFSQGINNLNAGINNLGNTLASGLGELGNAIGNINIGGGSSSGGNFTGPSYNTNPDYSGGSIGGNAIPKPNLVYNWRTDWAEEALKYASMGDINTAYQCVQFRERKLKDPEYLATGGTGNGLSQAELLRQVTAAYNASKRGYAKGIEEGPVTETGLAMLHGTSNKPEYVLNNDQAYMLLRNLTTNKLNLPETSSLTDSETSLINNDNTETLLEGVNKAIAYLTAISGNTALTNSQLSEIQNILGNLRDASNLIYQSMADKNVKLDTYFTNINSVLEDILKINTDDLANDKFILEAIKNKTSNISGGANNGSTGGNVIKNPNENLVNNIGNIINGNNTSSDKEFEEAMDEYDKNTDNKLHGVLSFTDNSKNQGGYNNGNTGGNYYVGENGVPDHYLGPQGEMIYQQTVGGTIATDSLGNKYDVSEQGEYIKRGIGGGNTSERRLDLANTYQYVNGSHIWYDELGSPHYLTASQLREKGFTPIEYEPGDRKSPTPKDETDSTGGAKNKTNAIDIHDSRYFEKVYYDTKGKEITLETAKAAGLGTIEQYLFKYGADSIGYRRKEETINENSNLYNTAPKTDSAIPAGTGGFNNSSYVSSTEYDKALKDIIDTAKKDKDKGNYTSDKTVTNKPDTSFGSYVSGSENKNVDLNANYTQLAYEAAQNGDKASAEHFLNLMESKISQSNYTGTKTSKDVELVRANVKNILSVADQTAVSGEYTANSTGKISDNTLKATEQNQEIIGTQKLVLNSSKETTEAVKTLSTSLKGLVTWKDTFGNIQTGTTTDYNNASSSGKVDYSSGYDYDDRPGSSTTSDGRLQWYDKTGGLHTGSQAQYNNALKNDKVDLYKKPGSSSSSNKGSSSSSNSSSNKNSSSSSSSNKTSSSSSSGNKVAEKYEKEMEKKGYEKTESGGWKLKSSGLRANGIEGGPIETVGDYTLHGSKSSPEYVLNSSQAYTLLRNFSTQEQVLEDNKVIQAQTVEALNNYTGLAQLHGMPLIYNNLPTGNDQRYNNLRNLASLNIPEIESTFKGQDMVQYVLNGDINLETDNPKDFFDELMRTMQMRANVTNHSRK